MSSPAVSSFPNLFAQTGNNKLDIFVSSNDDSVSSPDQHPTQRMRDAGNLDEPFIDYHFRIAARRNSDAELSAAHGNRGGRTIHAIGIRSPTEVVDPNAHSPNRD